MIFDSSPISNQRISSGTQASDGTARIAPRSTARAGCRRTATGRRARRAASPSAGAEREADQHALRRDRDVLAEQARAAARSTAAVHDHRGRGELVAGRRRRRSVASTHASRTSAAGRIAPSSARPRRRGRQGARGDRPAASRCRPRASDGPTAARRVGRVARRARPDGASDRLAGVRLALVPAVKRSGSRGVGSAVGEAGRRRGCRARCRWRPARRRRRTGRRSGRPSSALGCASPGTGSTSRLVRS